MPSERIAKCFSDILAAVELIESWISDADDLGAAIHIDSLLRSGIERQLLVISEAAIRMDKIDINAAPRLAPDIDWPGIRGMGNVIRHKYDDLDTEIIVNAVNNRFASLRAACLRALESLSFGSVRDQPQDEES